MTCDCCNCPAPCEVCDSLGAAPHPSAVWHPEDPRDHVWLCVDCSQCPPPPQA